MEIFTESQFSACYIHYRRRVRGYILSRVSDREEAEDLTQDVFENIWRCREGVRKETLHNLVYTVMRNTVIDYLRRRYMKKDKMDIYTCCEEEGRNTVEEDYYYKELRVAHRKMVKQLSEKRRQAYLLYFYRGMSYASIYNPQIQISAESETKRSIFREKDKTKRSKKESAQHSKSRNKSFVMTSVSAL